MFQENVKLIPSREKTLNSSAVRVAEITSIGIIIRLYLFGLFGCLGIVACFVILVLATSILAPQILNCNIEVCNFNATINLLLPMYLKKIDLTNRLILLHTIYFLVSNATILHTIGY
jgi:hypothetical protein